jgi:pimeloyl-ACP methyl ester carboxylesterase
MFRNLIRGARWLLFLAAASALSYASACAYMWATQRQHIFEPSPLLQTTPARNGMRYEEVRIPSGGGQLHGWWIPAVQSDAPALLYLHGNFRNISNNPAHTARLHSMGYNLLLVDYRGYGKSSGGEPGEEKMYEDAEAAWDYLIRQRGVPAQRAFIYGNSLGGAVGMELAMRHPEAAGLIAESTFTSMVDMARRDYAYLPVDWLVNQRFDSLAKVGRLKIPVLFIHGTWDAKVPYQMSQQLYDRAPQPKTLKLIEGGEHSNNSSVAWLEYREVLNEFVEKYARREQPEPMHEP